MLVGGVLAVMMLAGSCTGDDGSTTTSMSPLTPQGSVPPLTTTAVPATGGGRPGSTDRTAGPATGTDPVESTAIDATAGTPTAGTQTTGTRRSESSGTPGPSDTPAPSDTDGSTDNPPSTGTTPPSGGDATGPTGPTTTRSQSTEFTVVKTTTAEELATRKEIKAAWLRYWDVYVKLNRIPTDKREEAYSKVAVEPELGVLLETARRGDEAHVRNYGSIGHRIYWSELVAGKDVASIGDCTDRSGFGTVHVSTGEKEKPGPKSANFSGDLRRQPSGEWKVAYIDYLEGEQC